MITGEYEIKILIDELLYEKILKLFQSTLSHAHEQINYYYDTYDQKYRRNNTTIQLRHVDNKISITVKDRYNKYISKEQFDDICYLPSSMSINDETVYLHGFLKTYRITMYLSDSMKIVVDKNYYFDIIDYELEVKYKLKDQEKAKGIELLLQNFIDFSNKEHSVLCKSERFFRKLNSVDTKQLDCSIITDKWCNRFIVSDYMSDYEKSNYVYDCLEDEMNMYRIGDDGDNEYRRC